MEIRMPKLGLTMTEATLVRWLKAAGDPVTAGEILFEFESDKSLLEFESPTDGVLEEPLVGAGETVPVGTLLVILATTAGGRRVPAQPEPGRRVIATPAARRQARLQGVDLAALSGRGPAGRIQAADVAAVAPVRGKKTATPLARRIAAELDLDLAEVRGSGPGGRVVKADVLAASESPAPPSDLYRDREPLSGVRRIIADRMSQSAFSAPHVTLFAEADATPLVEARRQLNDELAGRAKISYNALLLSLVARALGEHPRLNACLVDDEVCCYRAINIALAVDTERGLLAPVVRDVDQRPLLDLQQTLESLVERTLAGRGQPDDLSGGTFTITNLGMFDIDGFTPIINQPQAAILGVGQIAARPVVYQGAIAVRQTVILSLSFDHRLVDGGPAARFLQRIKQLIERPLTMLVWA